MTIIRYQFYNSAVIFDNFFNLNLDASTLLDILHVKQVIFGDCFDRSIDKLNIKITHLKLKIYFSEKFIDICDKFKVLTHLELINCDNIKSFPISLVWLKIHLPSNNNININLPPGLLYFINNSFNCDNLPCGLLYLQDHVKNCYNKFPSSLKCFNSNYKYLSMDKHYINLPNNINNLTLLYCPHYVSKIFGNLVYCDHDIILNNLPQSLNYLKFELSYFYPVIIFPEQLIKLVLYVDMNKYEYVEFNLLKIVLPSKLKFLECQFNFCLLNIPNTVEKMVINYINKIMELCLPSELKILIVTMDFINIEKYHLWVKKIFIADIKNNYEKFYKKIPIKISILKMCDYKNQNDEFMICMNNILDTIHSISIPNILC